MARKSVLIAVWIVTNFMFSIVGVYSSVHERVLLVVIPMLGVVCGSRLEGGHSLGAFSRRKVVQVACFAIVVLLLAEALFVGFFLFSNWVSLDSNASDIFLRIALIYMGIEPACVRMSVVLSLVMGLCWGVLAASWVCRESDAVTEADSVSPRQKALFEAFVLLLGALCMFVRPLLDWGSGEWLGFQWIDAALPVTWVFVLWPILKCCANASGEEARRNQLGHCFGLLAVGTACAGVLIVSEPSVFGSPGTFAWMSFGLLAFVGCALCVLVWRISGKRKGGSSADTEVPSRLPTDLMGLTVREYEALSLAVSGSTSKDIGTELGIAASTAREYVRRARAKLAEQGLSEQDVLQQKQPDQTLQERDEHTQAEPFVFCMTSLVAVALSPFGLRFPVDGAFVAALLVGFAAGGLVLVPLRHLEIGVPSCPRWLCVLPAVIVLLLRVLLWFTQDAWLVVTMACASAALGFLAFLEWGRLGRLNTIMGERAFPLFVWATVLGCCCACLWVVPMGNEAYIALMACAAVLACGFLAVFYLVARWALVYILACMALFAVIGVLGSFGWASAIVCCVPAFAPWAIEGMKAERKRATCNSLILRPAWVFPACCILGALLSVLVSLYALYISTVLLIVLCSLLALASAACTFWFVWELNAALHIERIADATEGDNEALVRAWLGLYGVVDLNADVALGLARGERVSAIAERLGYSNSAIRRARQTSYRLLRIHSRLELARLFESLSEASSAKR